VEEPSVFFEGLAIALVNLTRMEYGYWVYSPLMSVFALPPYMTNIFGEQNTGRPQEIFSNASGKPSAILRTCASPRSSSRNMIGCGMVPG
jgi:hypothetical protein